MPSYGLAGQLYVDLYQDVGEDVKTYHGRWFKKRRYGLLLNCQITPSYNVDVFKFYSVLGDKALVLLDEVLRRCSTICRWMDLGRKSRRGLCDHICHLVLC